MDSKRSSRRSVILALLMVAPLLGCPLVERTLNEPPLENESEEPVVVNFRVWLTTETKNAQADPDGFTIRYCRGEPEASCSEPIRIGPNDSTAIGPITRPRAFLDGGHRLHWVIGDVAASCTPARLRSHYTYWTMAGHTDWYTDWSILRAEDPESWAFEAWMRASENHWTLMVDCLSTN